jgi:hypothetical protein
MDTSGLIPAFAAILGSTVGGLTTFATTFLNQRYMGRRDMLEKDVANREKLYSEFLTEVADLFDLSAPRPREQAGTACLHLVRHPALSLRPRPWKQVYRHTEPFKERASPRPHSKIENDDEEEDETD